MTTWYRLTRSQATCEDLCSQSWSFLLFVLLLIIPNNFPTHGMTCVEDKYHISLQALRLMS